MLYLKEFTFPSIETEEQFINDIQQTVYSSYYPFGILGNKLDYARDSKDRVDYKSPLPIVFDPITIFYGGNGSGKTTALNVIAEKINADRDSLFNRTNFFEDYLSFCRYTTVRKLRQKRIITSDDVFDFMLNLRGLNEGIDSKREDLFQDYLDSKHMELERKFNNLYH